jgi:uncharacterized membrane protein YkvA (DUF1232 family)
MLISHLRQLIDESGLSPEQLAGPLNMSGMTLRRLLKKPDSFPLPEAYQPLVDEGIYSLIIEGRLRPESAIAQDVLGRAREHSFEATIHSLGFPESTMALGANLEDRLIIGLSQIGASDKRQNTVRDSKGILARFEKLGQEWNEKLRALRKVLGSTQLSTFEKFAAYGALFYLITPTDLIPDTLPVFGLVDDFAILGIVVAYYLHRFPKLFE